MDTIEGVDRKETIMMRLTPDNSPQKVDGS
jgi:hypothetical protein